MLFRAVPSALAAHQTSIFGRLLKKMAIKDFTITLCVSSRRHGINDIASRIGVVPTRTSEASLVRDDHRVFWDFSRLTNGPFDDESSRAVAWAKNCTDLLSPIDDANVTLWYEVHSDSEFTGLTFEAAQLESLGARRISLVISVYAPGV